MTTYIWNGKAVVEKEHVHGMNLHGVIRDDVDFRAPFDGKHYSSKRAYEKAVRAAGCTIVGNEKLTHGPRHSIESPGHELARRIKGY